MAIRTQTEKSIGSNNYLAEMLNKARNNNGTYKKNLIKKIYSNYIKNEDNLDNILYLVKNLRELTKISPSSRIIYKLYDKCKKKSDSDNLLELYNLFEIIPKGDAERYFLGLEGINRDV